MSDIEKALAQLRQPLASNSTKNGDVVSKAAAVKLAGDEVEKRRDAPSTDPAVKVQPAPKEVQRAWCKSPENNAKAASNRLGVDLLASNQSVNAPASSKTESASPTDQADVVAGVSRNPIFKLPLQALLNDGFLVPDTPKGRITEEYRRVKRPLLKNLRKDIRPENSNIVMVTSSISGEGKTYTAINLAMSFALERDRTVLLVDGDVLKGSAGKVLGVDQNAPGLTDLLSGDCGDIGDAILTTDVPSLSIVPSGNVHDFANELLSSKGMSDCMNELSERYNDRIIVIDSPPILQTNEANTIAEHAGQVVFVVAEADTPQKTVTQALGHFDKDKYVGILINKSASAGKTYAYGYDYGYE